MPDGSVRLLSTGERSVGPDGRTELLPNTGRCGGCCTPGVLASFVTNAEDPARACWDLRPYSGINAATPCAYWRLIEVNPSLPDGQAHCWPPAYPWYDAGCVDRQGRLVGLGIEFCSPENYNGYMELQIGCLARGAETILWPGTCQPTSPVYQCGSTATAGVPPK